jgi:hypothetical protein
MDAHQIIKSSSRTPSTFVSSRLHPITSTSHLNAAAEQSLTTVVMASTSSVSLNRSAPSQLLTNRALRPQWARVRHALSMAGLAATRGEPDRPRAAAPDHRIVAEATDAGRVAEPANSAALAEANAGAASAESANGEGSVDSIAANPVPKTASGTSRVELTIDSLRTYELVKPIPVFVESLGERHYVAEVPDLNINTSASSLSEILIVLKDSITQAYDELRIRRSLDPQQARQLKMLERYIGKSKRGWLERR